MWQVKLREQYACLLSRAHLLPSDRTPPGVHCTILNYHYFSQGSPDSYLAVSADSLKAQLTILRDSFAVFPVHDAAEILTSGGSLPCKIPAVAISIDEGCSSFEEVLPVFERLNLPVTLFVPPGLCLGSKDIDGQRSWCLRRYAELDDRITFAPAAGGAADFFAAVQAASSDLLQDWTQSMLQLASRPDPISQHRLLSADRLTALARHPLITLAAHSMSHQPLALLPPVWSRWEIEKSLEYIGNWGGNTGLFSYPYGNLSSFDRTTQELLAAHGVRYAMTTLAFRVSKTSNPLALGRASMYDAPAFHYVRGTAGGAFEIWDTLRFAMRSRKR